MRRYCSSCRTVLIINIDKVFSIEVYSENITSIVIGSVVYHLQLDRCELNEHVCVSPHIPILMRFRNMAKSDY